MGRVPVPVVDVVDVVAVRYGDVAALRSVDVGMLVAHLVALLPQLGAMAVGTLASVGGLLVSAFASFEARVAPGPTIVLLALVGFAVTLSLIHI